MLWNRPEHRTKEHQLHVQQAHSLAANGPATGTEEYIVEDSATGPMSSEVVVVG